jgi:hypothetical protein
MDRSPSICSIIRYIKDNITFFLFFIELQLKNFLIANYNFLTLYYNFLTLYTNSLYSNNIIIIILSYRFNKSRDKMNLFHC